MKKILSLITSLLLTVVISGAAPQTQPIDCGNGISFRSTITVGTIHFTPDPAQVCAKYEYYHTSADSFTASLATNSWMVMQAQANIEAVLAAFQWRDPVVYDLTMKQYGLSR